MQQLIENLEENGFEVVLVKDAETALEIGKSYIKDGQSVGLGGSVTVTQIGMLDYLINHPNIKLYNQYEDGISMEENLKRRREGLLSDIYITSCNAITKNGELVNADGSGNRVAAQIFGPKKVLLFVSTKKIVETLEDGFKRIMEHVAPKNVERMNKKLLQMGKNPHYTLDNIANKFAYINGDERGRTTIILIEEELGY